MQTLKGQTAIITGAGKGLGKAMALAFAVEGINLGLIARTESDLQKVSEEAKKINPEITISYAIADVADYTQVQNAVAKIAGELKTIDILINNAGVLKVGGLLEMPVAEWEQVIKVNVLGAYYVLHEVLPYILKQEKGDIVNISSTAGLKGNAKLSAYGASKAAFTNLSEAVMQEVRKSNIRVTTVSPSTIATDMTMDANFTDGNKEKVLQPEDLAYLVINNLKLPPRAFVKELGLWSTNP
ncbi:short-chain alcohol dehydrogenase [Bernardetia litoralis DSM 6794]|uniref:Short-chain alcohol dehydrogenase n=1 Tax=Bernardetia litoralis (strain ATCC 23117 / DSM 6794 / NBRC 15988 / NCIMB 1366 / Fx l1 / Sio-4) TaxID=880071 RepID=I4APP2_BERLS|nr:3-ketoacyl-ACP reductase [Bernardetia litoralis]AFM05927.1 short-chain alcohol dehydrogenase [Bernardetia litoralis DSM 6794]